MVHAHTRAEWAEHEPLEPREAEDEQMQLDMIEFLIERLIQKWPALRKFQPRVEQTVAQFWSDNFAKNFRTLCCKGDSLEEDLYRKLGPLSNGGRLNIVIQYLNFAGIEDFLRKEEPRLKDALLTAGIDMDVIEASASVLH